MTTRLVIALALLAAALHPGPALAQVYTWVDKDGTVHFGEEPPADGQRARTIELPEEEPASAQAPEPNGGNHRAEPATTDTPPAKAARADPTAARPKPAPTVDLYTTSWCPWCKKAREYFRSRGIAFTEHDIEIEAGALERKYGLDGDKRVPTAIIGGNVVRGYSPARYRAALDQP